MTPIACSPSTTPMSNWMQLASGSATSGVFHGHEGLRRLFRELYQAWGEIEYGYDELIDAGQHVVAVVTRHARGRASGVEVEQPFGLLGLSARARWSAWSGS